MSIATKTGDGGSTSLMFNRRVSKCHPRVEAYGCVDELNSVLGLARTAGEEPRVGETLPRIQQDLIRLMGELATDELDLARFEQAGFARVTSAMTGYLDGCIAELEPRLGRFSGWAIPGACPLGATLDLARTVCRRAERRVCALQEAGQLHNENLMIYLNRLGDWLWLLARWSERASDLGVTERHP